MQDMDEIVEVAEYVKARFASGRGADLRMECVRGIKRLLLIPSPLYSENSQEIHLAIVLEDYGCYIWDRKNPIDVFNLVIAGFSLKVAELVALLIGTLFPYRIRRKPVLMDQQQPGQVLQLENKPND